MSSRAACRCACAFVWAFTAFCVQAELTVKDAWVRATVPAQKTTAAYMTFVSTEYARIVEVRTPAAGHAAFHRTQNDKGVMRMEHVDDYLLVPNRPMELKPGDFHVMLMDLPKPLAAGTKVAFTFVVEGRRGERSTVEAIAEVRASSP